MGSRGRRDWKPENVERDINPRWQCNHTVVATKLKSDELRPKAWLPIVHVSRAVTRTSPRPEILTSPTPVLFRRFCQICRVELPYWSKLRRLDPVSTRVSRVWGTVWRCRATLCQQNVIDVPPFYNRFLKFDWIDPSRRLQSADMAFFDSGWLTEVCIMSVWKRIPLQ